MPHTILFLAANPTGTDRIALDREARAIQVELERSGYRERFVFVTRWATEPLDLLRELRRLRPTIVHVSGHGSDHVAPTRPDVTRPDGDGDGEPVAGLYFQSADGEPRLVSPAALQDAFAAAGSSVKLVVLSACYSEQHAEALIAYIDCVVGMTGAISDDAARSFAIGFYGGLAEQESVAVAFRQGEAALSLHGLRDDAEPQLKIRAGVDANLLVPAADPRKPRSQHDPPLHAPASRRSDRELTSAGVRSTVHGPEGEPPFVGRDAELRTIEDALEMRRSVVVHGAPGLGKTRLAREYAHRHAADYPGGMYFVPFEQPPPIELAKLLRDSGKPMYPDDALEDRCRRALRELGGAGRVLLIYDAVADQRTLRSWLPYEGLDWRVIATSTSANWATSWSTVELGPLPDGAARTLASAILGNDATAASLVEPIVARAAGLTIELCASAATAHERLRRGGTIERVSAELASATSSSFESALALLSDDARLLLQFASTFVTARVPVALVGDLLQHSGWTEPRIAAALDSLRDRKLVGGGRKAIELHHLVARFVRAREPLGEPARRRVFHQLVAAARALAQDPGDLDRRDVVLAYSLVLADWDIVVVDGREAHAVGKALGKLGRFADAVPWFERAVAIKQRRAADKAFDTEAISASLHQLGYCLSHLGRFEEALPWFERAVAVKQRGDARGRVHAASLSTSLHQVGHCHVQLGRFEAALPWFERAVVAAEASDRDGRIDSTVLGASLHRVGVHHQNLGRFAEAVPWFERAVHAQQRGDKQGRVDPARLAASLLHLGQCHVQLGRCAEALPWLERAVAAAERGDAYGRLDHDRMGDNLLWLGLCFRGLGRHPDALSCCERSVAEKQYGDEHGRIDHANLGKSLGQVGVCYMKLKRFAEALPWLERAVDAKQRGNIHGRVDAASIGRSLDASARCCERLGRRDDARKMRQRAERMASRDATAAERRHAPAGDDDASF